MKLIKNLLLLIIIQSTLCYTSFAADKYYATRYPDIIMRNGTGKERKIIHILHEQNTPIKKIYNIDNWDLVVDVHGHEGWVLSTNITNLKRTSILLRTSILCHKPVLDKQKCVKISMAHAHTIVFIKQCNSSWCRVRINNKLTGWIERDAMWGASNNWKS